MNTTFSSRKSENTLAFEHDPKHCASKVFWPQSRERVPKQKSPGSAVPSPGDPSAAEIALSQGAACKQASPRPQRSHLYCKIKRTWPQIHIYTWPSSHRLPSTLLMMLGSCVVIAREATKGSATMGLALRRGQRVGTQHDLAGQRRLPPGTGFLWAGAWIWALDTIICGVCFLGGCVPFGCGFCLCLL